MRRISNLPKTLKQIQFIIIQLIILCELHMALRNRPRNVSTRSSSGTLTTTGNSATTRNLAAANSSIEHTNGEHLSSPMDCSTDYSTHLEGNDANVDPLTIDTDGSRRHRGPTRGLGIDQHVDHYGRIAIVIEEEDGKPTDENAQKLSSECGCIVRQFAPLQVQKWSKIPMNDRKALFPYLLNKFDIDISAPHICMQTTDYRHDLHLQYQKSRSLAKAKAEFPNLSEEDWNYLCTQLFNTPEFQKLSAQNAKSRACLQFLHRGGSRSFISRGPKPKKTPAKPPKQLQEPSQEELQEPSQEELQEPPKNNPIKLFHDKHWSEKKGWINEVAESKYDEMMALLEEHANKEESERLRHRYVNKYLDPDQDMLKD